MRALVLIGSIGDIPGTIILLPFHLAGWRRHFDIHVRPAEFLNEFVHLFPREWTLDIWVV